MNHTRNVFLIALMLCTVKNLQGSSCYASSIYVPRQLAYNPVLENALVLDAKINEEWKFIFSTKPIYTQTVESSLNKYFMIKHKCSLNVQEDGSGDVSSLWFKVISSDDTFYSSTLSFHPKMQKYGAMLYGAIQLPWRFNLAVNTAIVNSRNHIRICEQNITNEGTLPCYTTVTQAFANPTLLYGRICGTHTKTGFDDVQIKLICDLYNRERMHCDIYGLLGAPTGRGSKAINLFEPLVGSRHVQLGVGSNMQWQTRMYTHGQWSFLAEAKYRYGLQADEWRTFDLTANGQWSRYMLFVNAADPYTTFPAINDLRFKTKVTPKSSFDLYFATHCNRENWHFELGYDFWYRSAEKISLCSSLCSTTLPDVGIADLVGIARQDPFTASTANISQGVQPGINQMVSDTTFVPVTLSDINLCSGAQPRSLSNTIYGSIGYEIETANHGVQIGINTAYEQGSSNTSSGIAAWLNIDLYY